MYAQFLKFSFFVAFLVFLDLLWILFNLQILITKCTCILRYTHRSSSITWDTTKIIGKRQMYVCFVYLEIKERESKMWALMQNWLSKFIRTLKLRSHPHHFRSSNFYTLQTFFDVEYASIYRNGVDQNPKGK